MHSYSAGCFYLLQDFFHDSSLASFFSLTKSARDSLRPFSCSFCPFWIVILVPFLVSLRLLFHKGTFLLCLSKFSLEMKKIGLRFQGICILEIDATKSQCLPEQWWAFAPEAIMLEIQLAAKQITMCLWRSPVTVKVQMPHPTVTLRGCNDSFRVFHLVSLFPRHANFIGLHNYLWENELCPSLWFSLRNQHLLAPGLTVHGSKRVNLIWRTPGSNWFQLCKRT